MKKVLAIIIFSALIATVHGQTERGTVFMAGELGGFNSGDYYNKTGDSVWVKDYSKINLLVSPKFGYFPANNFLLGIELIYGIERYKFDNGNTYSAEQLGFLPFVRLYFPAKKFLPFAEVGGGVYNEIALSVINNIDFLTKYPGFTYNAGAGIAFMAGEKVAFEFRAGYLHMQSKRLESNPLISQKNGSIFFRAGVALYFNKK